MPIEHFTVCEISYVAMLFPVYGIMRDPFVVKKSNYYVPCHCGMGPAYFLLEVWVVSAQLQKLSLSSQWCLWLLMTHQPAYFMIWVQPHHGRSNGNKRLRVVTFRVIIVGTWHYGIRNVVNGHVNSE
jgi:hypothetical protein